jgi:hypothetical protein
MPLPTSPAELKRLAIRAVLAFIAMRVLTGGLMGSTLSATLAGVLASIARAKPHLVPQSVRPAVEPLQAAARTKGGQFAAAALIDAVGAAMVAAPGWVRFLVGGAGFTPIITFAVAYLFPKMTPLVGFSALEAACLVPFAHLIPTCLVAWGLEHGYIPRAAVDQLHGGIMKVIKTLAGRALALS